MLLFTKQSALCYACRLPCFFVRSSCSPEFVRIRRRHRSAMSTIFRFSLIFLLCCFFYLSSRYLHTYALACDNHGPQTHSSSHSPGTAHSGAICAFPSLPTVSRSHTSSCSIIALLSNDSAGNRASEGTQFQGNGGYVASASNIICLRSRTRLMRFYTAIRTRNCAYCDMNGGNPGKYEMLARDGWWTRYRMTEKN